MGSISAEGWIMGRREVIVAAVKGIPTSAASKAGPCLTSVIETSGGDAGAAGATAEEAAWAETERGGKPGSSG